MSRSSYPPSRSRSAEHAGDDHVESPVGQQLAGAHDGPGPSAEFAGIVWAFTAGAWPMAHPSPVVAAVMTEPRFAAMRVDFTSATTRALTIVLNGLTRPR
jgi:hypothetical protein